MFGCFRSIGCFVILIALAVIGWFNRDQLRGVYSRVTGNATSAETVIVRDGGWQPLSQASAERGRRAVQSLSARSGPAFANLTPSEAASYIFLAATKTLPPSAEDISASVIDEKLYVRANVALADFGGGKALGPLASLLGDRDTIQLGGTIRVIKSGLGEFVVQDVKIGKFPVPSAVIPRLIGQIRKADRPPEVASNGLPMKLPAYIGDVRITNGRITVPQKQPVSGRVLVVDDEQGVRAALGQLLEYEGYEVRSLSNAADGIAEYQKWKPNLTFMDVKMAGMDGLEALKRIRELDPAATVVMISGHATIRTAVEATQLGAYEILEKPLDTDRILVMLRNIFDHISLREENVRLRDGGGSPYEIVGSSPLMRALVEKIEKVGNTPARVLVTGENGTGKELVARALHRHSGRAGKTFIEVNCAAIPGELIESELFGHMKGSFTGAIADRPGKFEQANRGTLFLDEIGDMSMAAQAKVLRVLQDNVITRIGGSKPISVDVRVIAATNKNLETEIAAGRFREDLYYRLNVVPIHVPPLREHTADIPDLVSHFIAVLSQREGITPRRMSEGAMERLMSLDWPGNVRELRNTVERMLILATGPELSAKDVDRLAGARVADDTGLASLTACRTFEEFKEAAERAYLLGKLREFDWNVSETARAVEMPRSNLYKKIERYALTREHS